MATAVLVAFAACCHLAIPGVQAAEHALLASQDRVVAQTSDISCGPAALATILTYQFDDPVSDAEVTHDLLGQKGADHIAARRGFSLLDLKRYAESRGYTARGYGDLTIDDLVGLGPAIVRLHDGTRNHFVVFRGRRHGQVLLADPANGTQVVSEAEFELLWQGGEAFVVRHSSEEPEPGLLSATAADFSTAGAR